jgi:hypothetical protein
MCIVESYRFIENDTMSSIFNRLSEMIKGIADPVVAAYARVYLARKGREANRYKTDYVMSGFNYFIDHQKVLIASKGYSLMLMAGTNFIRDFTLKVNSPNIKGLKDAF